MTKEQAIEKIKWSIHINKLTKDINGSNTSINVEVLKTVLTMLEEKDKQIDLMANHIATSDSDLCEYLDITTKCKYYAGDNGKTCDNCIKQYFENKAKEVK
jgi:hypothetical protein